MARFTRLVIDTSPLLRGTVYAGLAEHFYTVPQVLEEVKDKETRERLRCGHIELTLRNPSPAAVKLTLEAAQRTGDRSSLSATDLKLVALCLTLDMELHPDREYVVRYPAIMNTREDHSKKDVEDKKPEDHGEGLEKSTECFEGEWITPETLGALNMTNQPDNGKQLTEDSIELACMSSDFAVQNLLLSLRLEIYSPEGQRIRQIKSFLLRCHACGWTTHNTTGSKFCMSCGSATLLRTTYSIDSLGQKRIWLKKNFEYNLRGTKYSLPKPQGGRHAATMVLRADQPEYIQGLRTLKRHQEKLSRNNDPDAVDDHLAAIFGDMCMAARAKQGQRTGTLAIGHGRRNPNQVTNKHH